MHIAWLTHLIFASAGAVGPRHPPGAPGSAGRPCAASCAVGRGGRRRGAPGAEVEDPDEPAAELLVHDAVDDRVVHRVGHGQPVDAQVHLLKNTNNKICSFGFGALEISKNSTLGKIVHMNLEVILFLIKLGKVRCKSLPEWIFSVFIATLMP